jgi:hypothetical protein
LEVLLASTQKTKPTSKQAMKLRSKTINKQRIRKHMSMSVLQPDCSVQCGSAKLSFLPCSPLSHLSANKTQNTDKSTFRNTHTHKLQQPSLQGLKQASEQTSKHKNKTNKQSNKQARQQKHTQKQSVLIVCCSGVGSLQANASLQAKHNETVSQSDKQASKHTNKQASKQHN